MADNIVLTGFMGTGKSAVGRALAEALGREYVDTDEWITLEHQPIPEIFATHGEEMFRRLELELAEHLAERTGQVIATGGGMLLAPAVHELLSSTGRVFCLTASPATIIERVRADGIEGRPLLAGDDPEGRIGMLLEGRAPRYAEYEQVPTDGLTIAEVVAELLARLDR